MDWAYQSLEDKYLGPPDEDEEPDEDSYDYDFEFECIRDEKVLNREGIVDAGF